HLPGQRSRRVPGADSIPALLLHLSRQTEMDSAPWRGFSDLRAWAGAAGDPVGIHPGMAANGCSAHRDALAAGPRVAGISGRYVPGGCGSLGLPDAPRERSYRTPPIDLATERCAAGDDSVRAVLRCPVHLRRSSEPGDESCGAVAAVDSTDVGLRDPALPADGRGRYLPAG